MLWDVINKPKKTGCAKIAPSNWQLKCCLLFSLVVDIFSTQWRRWKKVFECQTEFTGIHWGTVMSNEGDRGVEFIFDHTETRYASHTVRNS